jgi:hypothetical protein
MDLLNLTKLLEEHNCLHLHFAPEDGGIMFLWNVGIYLQVYMVS